jgi:hypothetical protein
LREKTATIEKSYFDFSRRVRMSKYSGDQLKQRAFQRIAWVLKHFYDEQEYHPAQVARLHTRIFDALIFDEKFVIIGKSIKLVAQQESEKQAGKRPRKGYIEHIVPCKCIINLAFESYRKGADVDSVTKMVGDLLKIAIITADEADLLNKDYKQKMPNGWDWKNDSATKRLEMVGIKLNLEVCADR